MRRRSSHPEHRGNGVRPARKQGDAHVCPSCDQANFRVVDWSTEGGLFHFVARCRVCSAFFSYEKKL